MGQCTFLWLSSIYLLLFCDSTLKTSWGKKHTLSTISGIRWSWLGLFPYSGSEQKREAWPVRGFSPLITVIASRIDTYLFQAMTHDETYINGVRKTGSLSCWTWTGRICLRLPQSTCHHEVRRRKILELIYSSGGNLTSLPSGLWYFDSFLPWFLPFIYNPIFPSNQCPIQNATSQFLF